VKAIISLAHSLKLKVVAEGVESVEQLEFLKGLGCDQYQGFYYSPAVSSRRFEELVRSSGAPDLADDAGRTYSKLAVYKPQ